MNDLVTRLRGAGPTLRALTPAARGAGLVQATREFDPHAAQGAPDPIGGARTRLDLVQLAEVTGYSPPVLQLGIERLMTSVTAGALESWWNDVGGASRPAPEFVGIVAAGNIPGVALAPVLVALLAGAAVLVKSSMSEPLLVPAWHRALADVAPNLAAACAVVPWPGGEVALEDAAFGSVDRLLVFGSDATVQALRRRFPGRVSGYGTGLSVAVVTGAARNAGSALALARDVAAWDQQGCLSPHGAFVEGTAEEVAAFGNEVAEALARVESELPRGVLSAAEAGRVRNLRAEAEARALAGVPVRLWAPRESLAWTVLLEPTDSFLPSVLSRTLTLWPVPQASQIVARLAPWRAALQGVGVAVEPERAEELSGIVSAAGFGWSATLGSLQAPPLRWANKGRDILADLLTPSVGAEG